MSRSCNDKCKPVKSLPEVCSAKQVAEVLNLNVKTVYSLAKNKVIPCRKAGKKILFSRDAVLNWLNGRGE